MARQARSLLPDGTFHVTARAGFEQLLFKDDDDRRTFLSLLKEFTTEFGLECLAYCLMGTHYHLLLNGSAADLSTAMRRLNGSYAHYFNERHDRRGHVFGQRYTTRAVLTEKHLEELWRYIEENPLRSGLCAPGTRWPWMWRYFDGTG